MAFVLRKIYYFKGHYEYLNKAYLMNGISTAFLLLIKLSIIMKVYFNSPPPAKKNNSFWEKHRDFLQLDVYKQETNDDRK